MTSPEHRQTPANHEGAPAATLSLFHRVLGGGELWPRQTPRASKPATTLPVLVSALVTFAAAITVLAQSVPDKPIIVSIPPDKPKSELSGLADVLIGSLGLTGIIVIAAVLMGAIMAALMFWVRSRSD